MFIENKLFVELWGERALFTRPELKAERQFTGIQDASMSLIAYIC